MTLSLRHTFVAWALAGCASATASPAGAPIGLVHLKDPPPFTLQEFIEPFGNKLHLFDDKENKQVLVRHWTRLTVFAFQYDENGVFTAVYSSFKNNDKDLCEALDILKTAKQHIHEYLTNNFSGQIQCTQNAAPSIH